MTTTDASADWTAAVAGERRHAAARLAIGCAVLVVAASVVTGMARSRGAASAPPEMSMRTVVGVASQGGSAVDGTTERWVRYSGKPAVNDVVVPPEAWTLLGDPGNDAERQRIYGAPGGETIGYNYRLLGYVPLDRAATFDARSARIARFGCDPVIDC